MILFHHLRSTLMAYRPLKQLKSTINNHNKPKMTIKNVNNSVPVKSFHMGEKK